MSEGHSFEPDYGTGTKKLSMYLIGFSLCVILTLIPFTVVLYNGFLRWQNLLILFLAAILQFIVQVIFFLRLNTKTEQSRINVMAFIFSILILFVIVAGSLWIMWSLHYNMQH